MWRPGEEAPTGDDVASLLFPNQHKKLPISKQRQLLPIFAHRDSLLYALETHRTVVIVGETGSGKTTQLPQFLHEAGWTAGGRQVICTQPRRVAVISVAQRVADEMGRDLGGVVGYAIRFDNKTSPSTSIKFCTDGLLVREALSDPLLSRISVVMVDEAHERSLHTDVLLGLLKKVQKRRPDLRIIISSATMDAKLFKDFFEMYNPYKRKSSKKSKFLNDKEKQENDVQNQNQNQDNKIQNSKNQDSDIPTRDTAVVCSISGRCHDVTIHYLSKPCFNYIKCSAETVISIHKRCPPIGDILAFLPGMEEVDQCCRLIRELEEGHSSNLWILPLYSNLPHFEQMKVFEKPRKGVRKVIVSTSISETSVTIDGVVHVIDAGFQRLPYFNPETGVEALMTSPESQASAKQRAGRAGRTQPGHCYRLYTHDTFLNIFEKTTPCEMQRTSLTWAILQLKALGIDDILHFNFVSPPAAATMLHGLEILYSLECLDDQCKISSIGEVLAEFPLEPRLAKVLLCSLSMGCAEEVCIIAAMLSVKDVWLHPRGSKNQRDMLDSSIAEFAVKEGDHITFLNVFREYEDERQGSSSNSHKKHQYNSGGGGGRASEWCQENMLSERSLKKAYEVRNQLLNYLSLHIRQNKWKEKLFSSSTSSSSSMKIESCGDDTSIILKCFIKGFFMNVARLGRDGLYHTLRGNSADMTVQLHPSSTLAKFGSPSEFVLFNQFVSTDLAYIRNCSKIDGKWLLELAPHFYTSQDAKGRNVIRGGGDDGNQDRNHQENIISTDTSSINSMNKNEYDLSSSSCDQNKFQDVISRIETSHTSLLTSSSKLAIPEGDSSVIGRPVFSKPVFKKPAPKPKKNESDRKKRRY